MGIRRKQRSRGGNGPFGGDRDHGRGQDDDAFLSDVADRGMSQGHRQTPLAVRQANYAVKRYHILFMLTNLNR